MIERKKVDVRQSIFGKPSFGKWGVMVGYGEGTLHHCCFYMITEYSVIVLLMMNGCMRESIKKTYI